MKVLIALVVLFGCVWVSHSQGSCSLDSPAKWLKCVNAFKAGKNDTSGNLQIKCEAAKEFLLCITDLNGCTSQEDYNSTSSEAHNILRSFPCKYVIMSTGSTSQLYVPLLLISSLTFNLV